MTKEGVCGIMTIQQQPVANSRGIAQLVEHRSPKPGVVGSSPATPAMKRSHQNVKLFIERIIEIKSRLLLTSRFQITAKIFLQRALADQFAD